MKRILIATSNPGKLRDFAGAAARYGIEVQAVPNFSSLPAVIEDGESFEANARKKAEAYSRYVPREMVIADDSGLEVDALGGAPGVHSARYAADQPHAAEANTDDEANNAKLIREIKQVPPEKQSTNVILRLEQKLVRDLRVVTSVHHIPDPCISARPSGDTDVYAYCCLNLRH